MILGVKNDDELYCEKKTPLWIIKMSANVVECKIICLLNLLL